ncbi:triose-phosphate isomerase [bacterium]|nr:triose-phosphate isomerase [bacterium]
MNSNRTPLLAANWKMNHHWENCEQYCAALRENLPEYFGASADNPAVVAPGVELAIFPPLPYLSLIYRLLEDSTIFLGSQDVSRYEEGAFTGEVSSLMLSDVGCDYCLLGHSERRDMLGETDADVALKLKRLQQAEVMPVICVGESRAQREAGRAVEHTLAQLSELKDELGSFDLGGFVIAYEPIWAIGTGHNASPQDAQEMAAAIRTWLRDSLNDELADSTLLLYGGSVSPDNIRPYLECPDIDGALIGGSSLDADKYAQMARIALELAG